MRPIDLSRLLPVPGLLAFAVAVVEQPEPDVLSCVVLDVPARVVPVEMQAVVGVVRILVLGIYRVP